MARTIELVRYIVQHLLRPCRNQRPSFDPTFPLALSSESIHGNPIYTERAPPKLRQVDSFPAALKTGACCANLLGILEPTLATDFGHSFEESGVPCVIVREIELLTGAVLE